MGRIARDASAALSSLGISDTGDATRARLFIRSFTTADDATFELPERGVTAIVGGNNVGKSALLNQLHSLLSEIGTIGQPALVKSIDVASEGDAADVVQWMASRAPLVEDPPHEYRFRWDPVPGTVSSGSLEVSRVHSLWANFPRSVPHELAPFVCRLDSVERRAADLPATQIKPDPNHPSVHPIHVLADDPSLRSDLDSLCNRAFGQHLTVDHYFANQQLRLGQPSNPPPPWGENAMEWADEIGSLPPLGSQGAGMKAFLTLLVPLITARFKIAFIDEPEAFLHPPQARVLGAELGRISRDTDCQVIVATHDRDLLVGLMESRASLTVLRLERAEDLTVGCQLLPQDLTEMWAKPTLRTGNILAGLFHRAVVVCEGDVDCVFLRAILDDLAADDPNAAAIVSDLLFVPAYGKQNLASVASYLRSVKVPTVAVADLDALRPPEVLRGLVEQFGGMWDDVDRQLRNIQTSLDSSQTPRPLQQVRDELLGVLDQTLALEPCAELNRSVIDKLRSVIRTPDPMRRVKRDGINAFDQAIKPDVDEILATLENLGILLLPVGEIERFAPSHTKNDSWLSKAIGDDAHKTAEAREFGNRLLGAVDARIAEVARGLTGHQIVPRQVVGRISVV